LTEGRYGILLGSTTWQSFPAGLIAFRALPRAQFATLQTAIVPKYFATQTVLPMLMALTFPSEQTAIGMRAGGFAGVFHESNRFNVLVPLATIFVTSLVNLAYFGPATTRCMRLRKHQETRDGKKSYDSGPHSSEMEKLNKEFSFLHGSSTLVNMVGWVSMLWYAFVLGARIS
jgi:hypothetical protein